MRGFIKHFVLDELRPDEISVLEDAFEDAWRRITSSKAPWASDDYSAAGRTILAKYIIAMAKSGERDVKWLSDSAVLYLSQQRLARRQPEEQPACFVVHCEVAGASTAQDLIDALPAR